MKRRQIIAAAALGTLLLAGCAGSPAASTAPQDGDVAADNLAMTMLAWELQDDTERARVCTGVTARGTDGTTQAFTDKHGGEPADWRAAALWLTDTCKGA